MSDLEALEAARSLEQAMGVLAGEVKGLRRYSHRNRHLIWALVLSVSFDLVVSVILALVVVKANHASASARAATSAAAQNTRSQKLTCEAGNDSRHLQRTLWSHVLDAERAQEHSAAERARLEEYRNFINTTFAPRDCDRLDGSPAK